MPTSLVIELQNLAQSGATDISELLRRSMVLSAKLKLDDFNEWFEHELNGYSSMAAVPEYRIVFSQLMSRRPPHPAQPVSFRCEAKEGAFRLAQHFSRVPVHAPVAQVAHLLAGAVEEGPLAFIHVPLSEGEMNVLVEGDEGFLEVEVFRKVGTAACVALLDAVRNRILKWSLELERKGILGDGMSFTKEEQATAASQITINGSVGSFVQGSGATVTTLQSSPGAEVRVATGSATINERMGVAVEMVRKLNPGAAESIEKLAEGVTKSVQLPEDKKAEASEALAVVAEQSALPAEQRLQKVVLTALLSSFRDNLSLSADLLQLWSTFGPAVIGWLGLILK